MAVTHEGRQVSVNAQDAVLLARNPGYRVSDERLTVGLNVQSGVFSVRTPVFVQSLSVSSSGRRVCHPDEHSRPNMMRAA